MGLIAEFWTLDAARRGELVDAFRPVERKVSSRRLLFFPHTRTEIIHPWHSYLATHAQEETKFPYSGVAFADLELLLPEGTGPFSVDLPESTELCAYCEASVALLDAAAAQAIRSSLATHPMSAADVVRFYEEDLRPLTNSRDAEFILAAHRQLLMWCEQVTPERIGILIVG